MTIRSLRLLSLMMVALLFSACGKGETAGACGAIVGKWNWFIGGEVTVKADGTFEQQSGNSGTWECTDGAAGRFVFKWKVGGFVNPMVLSGDGRALSSTDPAQSFVSAQRVGDSVAQQPKAGVSEVERLVARLNEGYRGSTGIRTLEQWGFSNDDFFDDSVTRAESLSLSDGFVLRVAYQECARPFASEQVVSVAECDAGSNGLKWESKSYTQALKSVVVSSIKSDGEHSVAFALTGEPYAHAGIACRDGAACRNMAADLKQLVTLAQPSQANASDDVAKDVAQRMDRINRAYKGSIVLADEEIAIQRGVRVTLEKGFILKVHSQWCDATGSAKEEEYEKANGVEKQIRDCDAKRDGLHWEDEVTELALPQVQLISSTVPKTEGPPYVNFRVMQRGHDVSTRLGCKSECLQVALDLAAFVNLAHRGSGQR